MQLNYDTSTNTAPVYGVKHTHTHNIRSYCTKLPTQTYSDPWCLYIRHKFTDLISWTFTLRERVSESNSNRDYYLAKKTLSWTWLQADVDESRLVVVCEAIQQHWTGGCKAAGSTVGFLAPPGHVALTKPESFLSPREEAAAWRTCMFESMWRRKDKALCKVAPGPESRLFCCDFT